MSESLTAAGAALDPNLDIGALLRQIGAGVGDDPFAVHVLLGSDSAALPPALRSTTAEVFLGAPRPVLREAAALLMLDPDAGVRRATAAALLARCDAATPAMLRRLIVMRHWLPEDERPLIDQAVRAMREKGIACDSLAPVQGMELQAFGVDGSGALGFMAITPAEKKKFRLSSVLIRLSAGILDAWTDEPRSRRRIGDMLASAGESAGSTAVAPRFLDQAVCHHLAVGLEQGRVPPLGLLQAAETLAAGEWRPRRIDPLAALDELLASRPEDARGVLRGSAEWADGVDAAGTWFEADQEVVDLLDRAAGRKGPRLVSYVVASVLERRRAKWTVLLAWTALRLQAETPVADPLWRPLAIVAREVGRGRPLDEIPLMREIARRTVEAHRAAAPDAADFPWDLLLAAAAEQYEPRRRARRRR
jgi:hypothetical protein